MKGALDGAAGSNPAVPTIFPHYLPAVTGFTGIPEGRTAFLGKYFPNEMSALHRHPFLKVGMVVLLSNYGRLIAWREYCPFLHTGCSEGAGESLTGRRRADKTGGNERGTVMGTIWSALGRLLDFFDTLALISLFTVLAFSVGYQIGFTSGLDTKVTLVGEKYTMKLTGK